MTLGNASLLAWTVALLLVAGYCGLQAFRDVRRRADGMAVLGMLAVVVILTIPIRTHAVKVDLPINAPR